MHHIISKAPLDSLIQVIVEQQVLLLQHLKFLLRLKAVGIEAIDLNVPLLTLSSLLIAL